MKFNPATRRCYKSCDQRNKDTHPMTKKCRAKCKKDKIRRTEDYRCVSKNYKVRTKKKIIKKVSPNTKVTRIGRIKNVSPNTKVTIMSRTNKVVSPKSLKLLDPPSTHTYKEQRLIPLPLEKKLVKNFGLLNEFLQKGKGVDAVDFDANTIVSDVIAIYFFKKYKQDCLMYRIGTVKSTDWLILFISLNDWNQTKFLHNLKLCLETGEKLIIVPLNLPGHLNMLFIKVTTREIIRFEPHGQMYIGDIVNLELQTNNSLKKLTNDINLFFDLTGDKKFTYKPPTDICPRNKHGMFYYGFQDTEHAQKPHTKEPGFCQLWSWFFAECVMANPEMDIKDVYKEAWDAVNTDEGNFATIIRGYFLSINEELLKMNKELSINSDNEWGNPSGASRKVETTRARFFLHYLNESMANLNTKSRKVFRGGINNKFKKPQKPRFILPSPNPHVTLMKDENYEDNIVKN